MLKSNHILIFLLALSIGVGIQVNAGFLDSFYDPKAYTGRNEIKTITTVDGIRSDTTHDEEIPIAGIKIPQILKPLRNWFFDQERYIGLHGFSHEPSTSTHIATYEPSLNVDKAGGALFTLFIAALLTRIGFDYLYPNKPVPATEEQAKKEVVETLLTTVPKQLTIEPSSEVEEITLPEPKQQATKNHPSRSDRYTHKNRR